MANDNKHFVKTFEKFEEGIESLLTVLPNLSGYIGDVKEEKAVIESLMDQIRNSIPTIYNPEYPATYAFSVSSREVGFRTRNNIAFGWRVLIDRETSVVTYEFRITIIIRNKFVNNNAIFSKLKDNNWAERVKEA